MRKTILICCLLITLKSNAKQDIFEVEHYCQIVAKGRFLSNKVTVDIDYGEERNSWKGNRIKDENGKFKKITMKYKQTNTSYWF